MGWGAGAMDGEEVETGKGRTALSKKNESLIEKTGDRAVLSQHSVCSLLPGGRRGGSEHCPRRGDRWRLF